MPPDAGSSGPSRPPRRLRRARTTGVGGWLVVTVLVVVTAVVVVFPAAMVGLHVVTAATRSTSTNDAPARVSLTPASVATTVGYAATIGALATALAFPAAWALRSGRCGRFGTALAAVPLLMPAYLAYAGWGLVRAPGSRFGNWLAVRDPAVIRDFERLLAVSGLALWIWPLAAFVLIATTRAVPESVLDALRIEAGSPQRRWAVIGRMLGPGVGMAFGVVTLVMLGSVIPLHVAQVPTYAINLWKAMDLVVDRAGVWRAAWPLLGVAVVGAVTVSRWVTAEPAARPDVEEEPGRRARPLAWSAGAAVWALSVAVPLSLYIGSIRTAETIPLFWRTNGAAIEVSGRVAAMVGAIGFGLCLLIWAAASNARVDRWVPRSVLGVFVFAGLVPGVLVGQAVNEAWNLGAWGRGVADSSAILVLAHLARFGVVGALVGIWLANREAREQRWLRTLDGGDGVRGWAVSRLAPNVGPAVGAGLAMAALSFHEIESTIIVQPPGLPSLAQTLLNALHYSRDEQLAGAAASLLVVGTGVAFAAGWLLTGFWAGKGSDPGPNDPGSAPGA